MGPWIMEMLQVKKGQGCPPTPSSYFQSCYPMRHPHTTLAQTLPASCSPGDTQALPRLMLRVSQLLPQTPW